MTMWIIVIVFILFVVLAVVGVLVMKSANSPPKYRPQGYPSEYPRR
jgi:uncharacterized protein YpmB